jgi:hypothetical protein
MKRRRRSLIVLLVLCSLLATAYLTYGVQRRWTGSLQKAVQETTRLRIRSGGTCHRTIERETTLAEITDAGEINRFIHGIVINGWRSGGACACCGDPTFEFYAGDRLLAMVGYHHTQRLRWAGGKWRGDGQLTAASRSFVISWLSQHGVEGPRQAREQEQKWRAEERRVEDRYAELVGRRTLAAVAEASREIWSSSNPREETRLREERRLTAQAAVFEKYEKDTKTSAERYLRFLGVRNNEAWDHYWENEAVIAMRLLPRFKGLDLAQAALTVMKDDEGRIGAARWFLGEGGWRNLDESDRERILPPLAHRALQHPHAGSRKIAMLGLTEINSAWVAELLRGTLSRPTDPNWTRPEAKPWYGYKIDLATGEQIYEGECSDAVWAAFCLAKMGSTESLPAIQKLADESQGVDRDLLDKAIQLLRDQNEKTPADQK